MAVTYIQERQGGAERSNGKLTRFRTLLYHVTSGSNPGDILLDKNIPVDGSNMPDYPGFVCIGVSSPQRDTGNNNEGGYTVQVNYSSNAGDVPVNKENNGKPPWQQKAYNVSIGGRDIVVPMLKGYKQGDSQFNPTEPVVHPATKEQLISDMLESHGIISFNYAVKTWDYKWRRMFCNTANSKDVALLGYTFPKFTLLLSRLSATQKFYTDANGKTIPYWEVLVEFEDFYREIKKELALQGYYCVSGGNVLPIQLATEGLNKGQFGFFDAKRPDLNISIPRWVDKDGVVLPASGTVGEDHYKAFYDIFRQDWSCLGLPKEKV